MSTHPALPEPWAQKLEREEGEWQNHCSGKLPLSHESGEFEGPNLLHPAISRVRAIRTMSPPILPFILNLIP